ncbi:MAG: hypothetical protein ACYS8K_06230, partial [Planctomycetota bacterium]
MANGEQRRSKPGAGCALAAAVLIVLAGLTGLGLYLCDRHWDRKVEGQLEGFRAAGEPVTWGEFVAAAREVPHEENAALVLLEVFNHLDEAFGAQLFGYPEAPLGTRHSEPVRGLAREHLARNARALELIHRAAGMPAAVYPLDPAAGPFDARMDERRFLRSAARLCVLEAAVRAEEGRGGDAVQALSAGLALANLREQPMLLIEALVRMAIDAVCQAGLEQLLGLCELPAERLSALREEIAREDRRLTLEGAMWSERATAHWMFNEGYLRPYQSIPIWSSMDIYYCYDLLAEAAGLARLPLRRRLRAARELGREAEERASSFPGRYSLANMLTPAIALAFREEVGVHVRLRVADAALAVEQWRVRHGEWPDSLGQLVPEVLEAVPQDPFAEGEIRYVRTPDGALLYSVGPDGRDNGGTSQGDAPP